MKKIKWEHILLFFLELLVNMATVGVAILLNALIDAAQISITSQDAHHLQKVLFISILYAVCLGVLVFLSNRYKARYIRKRLLEMRTVLADGTLQSSIANYEETGNVSYVTAFNQNFSIIEEKVLQNRISILDSVICIVFAVLVLLYMNPLIAVISIAAMAIPSLLPSLFTKVLGTAQETVMKSTTSYNETVADLLTGYEVIKTYHAEDEMFHKFSKTAKRLDSNKEHFSSLMASVYGLTTLSSVAVQFFIMGLAGFFAVKGYITIGSIVAVKLPSAFALFEWFPSILREPLGASDTLSEATAPVKLPVWHCPTAGSRRLVRNPILQGWYPNSGSMATGVTIS